MNLDSVREEPVFTQPEAMSDADGNGVANEPALSASPEATANRDKEKIWFSRQWTEGKNKVRPWTVAWFCLASVVMALPCALLKEEANTLPLFEVVVAPVVEETAKILFPLIMLEKTPWRFSNGFVLLAVCCVSGLLFASLENLLYFHLYIPAGKLTTGIIYWRLLVCTFVHVAGTALSGTGLVRAWQEAKQSCGRFNGALAWPYIIAAMILHGLYNAGALTFGLLTGNTEG